MSTPRSFEPLSFAGDTLPTTPPGRIPFVQPGDELYRYPTYGKKMLWNFAQGRGPQYTSRSGELSNAAFGPDLDNGRYLVEVSGFDDECGEEKDCFPGNVVVSNSKYDTIDRTGSYAFEHSWELSAYDAHGVFNAQGDGASPAGDGYFGSWIRILHPAAIILKELSFGVPLSATDGPAAYRRPGFFRVYGRNSALPDVTWEVIYERQGSYDGAMIPDSFSVGENDRAFDDIMIVVNRLHRTLTEPEHTDATHLAFRELALFGVPPLPVRVTTARALHTAGAGVTSLHGTTSTRSYGGPAFPPYSPAEEEFTLCYATRYSNLDNMGTILGCAFGDDSDAGCRFGHDASVRGRVVFNNRQFTVADAEAPESCTASESCTDWLVQCFSYKATNKQFDNADGEEFVHTVDKVVLVQDQNATSWFGSEFDPQTSSASSKPKFLSINQKYPDSSDFHIHSVYLWDVALSTRDMLEITASLRRELGGGPDALSAAMRAELTNHVGAVLRHALGGSDNDASLSCSWEYPPHLNTVAVDRANVGGDTRQAARADDNEDVYRNVYTLTGPEVPYARGTYAVESVLREASNLFSFNGAATAAVGVWSTHVSGVFPSGGYTPLPIEWEDEGTGSGQPWVVLSFPEAFALTHYQLSTPDTGPAVKSLVILGRLPNGEGWTMIHTWTAGDETSAASAQPKFVGRNNQHCQAYALQILERSEDPERGGDLKLDRWRLFGRPCPAGTAASGVECAPCAVGFYNAARGAVLCRRCPGSLVTREMGSTSMSACLLEKSTLGCVAGEYAKVHSESMRDVYTNGGTGLGYTVTASGNSRRVTYEYSHKVDEVDPPLFRSYARRLPEEIPHRVFLVVPAGTGGSQGVQRTVEVPFEETKWEVEDLTTCEACAPGHYSAAPEALVCTACAAGTFAASAGATACRACPAHMSTTGTGSTSLADCVCDAGWFMDPHGGCVACTPESTSPQGAETFEGCTCTAGSRAYKASGAAAHAVNHAAAQSCAQTVSVVAGTTCALLTSSGNVRCWGVDKYGAAMVDDDEDATDTAAGFVRVGGHGRVVQISQTENKVCALFDGGPVSCTGSREATYLPDGIFASPGGTTAGAAPVAIATSPRSVCALTDRSQLVCWGVSASLPDHATAGEVVSFGDGLGVVKLFGSGHDAMCALLSDASVQCWGRAGNTGPQNGAQTPLQDKLVLDVAMSGHACALFEGGSMSCWGDNSDGQCGRRVPVDVSIGNMQNIDFGVDGDGAARRALQFQIHSASTTVLLNTGEVATFGTSDVAGRGAGSADTAGHELHVVDLGGGARAIALSRGNADTVCAVLEDSSVKCWGANANGNAGMLDKANRGGSAGEMGADLPVLDFGAEAPSCTGVAKQPVCTRCDGASFWAGAPQAPNAPLSLPHDAREPPGDAWVGPPECPAPTDDGLRVHVSFDDHVGRNEARLGDPLALQALHSSSQPPSTLVAPGRVGLGYASIPRGDGYTYRVDAGAGSAPKLAGSYTLALWLRVQTSTSGEDAPPNTFLAGPSVSLSALREESQLRVEMDPRVADHTVDEFKHPAALGGFQRGVNTWYGRWTHVAVVVDVSDCHYVLYIDGVPSGVVGNPARTEVIFRDSGSCDVDVFDRAMQLGSAEGSIDVDDFRFYNVAMTAQQVGSVCARELRGLVLYAPFEGSSLDWSGYGVTGTTSTTTSTTAPHGLSYTNHADAFVGSGAMRNSADVLGTAAFTYVHTTAWGPPGAGFSVFLFLQVHESSSSGAAFQLELNQPVGTSTLPTYYRMTLLLDSDGRLRARVTHYEKSTDAVYGETVFEKSLDGDNGADVRGTGCHIGMSFEWSLLDTPLLRVWRNGEELESASPADFPPLQVERMQLDLLGPHAAGSGSALLGVVDDVRVFSRASTHADAQAMHAKSSQPACYDRAKCELGLTLDAVLAMPLSDGVDARREDLGGLSWIDSDVTVAAWVKLGARVAEFPAFPPADGTHVMTDVSDTTSVMTLSGAQYGNGAYELQYPAGQKFDRGRHPMYMFGRNEAESFQFIAINGFDENGRYTGEDSLPSTDGDVYKGAIFRVKSAHCLSMKTSRVVPRSGGTERRNAGIYRIYARMHDTDKWTRIRDISEDERSSSGDPAAVDVEVGGRCYLQHALVVHKLWEGDDSDRLNMGKWLITGEIIAARVTEFPVFPPEDGTHKMTDVSDTTATMTLSGAQYGNGAYELQYPAGEKFDRGRHPMYMFGRNEALTENRFIITEGFDAKGVYTGEYSLPSTDGDVYKGSILRVKSAHCLSMKTSRVVPRSVREIRIPGIYRIYARMHDTDEWTRIRDISEDERSSGDHAAVDVEVGGRCYLQHALVVHKLWEGDNSNYLNMGKWLITGEIMPRGTALLRHPVGDFLTVGSEDQNGVRSGVAFHVGVDGSLSTVFRAGGEEETWDMGRFALGEWTYVLFTYDRVSVCVYVNGIFRHRQTSAVPGTLGLTSGPMQLDTARKWTSDFAVAFQLEDLRVWGRTLPPAETLRRYGAHLPLADACFAAGSGAAGAQSEFAFYCTEAARVAWSVYYRAAPGSSSVHVRTSTPTTAFVDVPLPSHPLGTLGAWTTTSAAVAVPRGPNRLTVQVPASAQGVSHVRFLRGVGTCHFSTDLDASTAVCTRCPRQTEFADGKELGALRLPCAPCDVGSGFDESTNQCVQCPPGSFSNTTVGQRCDLCPVGTYQANTGRTQCLACEGFKRFADAAGSLACSECPFDTTTDRNDENACRCSTGWSLQADPGGVDMICTECPWKYYVALPDQVCIACPAHTEITSQVAQTQCLCRENYVSDKDNSVQTIDTEGERCVEDPKYECLANYYEPPGAPNCSPCPTNSTSEPNAEALEDCKCEPGFGGGNSEEGDCTVCSKGFFKSLRENIPCSLCPGARAFGVDVTPAMSVYTAGVGSTERYDCQCAAGFSLSTGAAGDDDALCMPCSPNTFRVLTPVEGDGSDTGLCVACPTGLRTFMQAATSEGACVCAAGEEKKTAEKACVACDETSFSANNGDGCSACPLGATSDESGGRYCICPEGSFVSGTEERAYGVPQIPASARVAGLRPFSVELPGQTHDAARDWPLCPAAVQARLRAVLHFTFDDLGTGLQNAAPFGPAAALTPTPTTGYGGIQSSPTLEVPGHVGAGYASTVQDAGYSLPGKFALHFSEYTLSFWVRWDANSWTVIFETNYSQLIILNDGALLWRIYNGRAAGDAQSDFLVTKNIWTHIAVVANIPRCEWTLYVDGLFKEVVSLLKIDGTTCGPFGEDTGLKIGGGKPIAGIDDFRFYNRLLSGDEVGLLCPPGMRRLRDGLVLHFPFDSQDGWAENAAPSVVSAQLQVGGADGDAYSMQIREPGVVGAGHTTVGEGSHYSVVSSSGELLEGVTTFTVAAWVRYLGSVGRLAIWSSKQLVISVALGGTHVYFRDASGNQAHKDSTQQGPRIEPDTWTHVACSVTLTETDTEIKIYVNGGYEAFYRPSVVVSRVTKYLSNVAGFGESNFGSYGAGAIDDFRLYDHALGQEEVATLYAMGSHRTGCYERVGEDGGYAVTTSSSASPDGAHSEHQAPWRVVQPAALAADPTWRHDSYNADGEYAPSTSVSPLTLDATYPGEWITVTFPHAFMLRHVQFEATSVDLRGSVPADYVVYGRNANAELWVEIHHQVKDAASERSTFTAGATRTNLVLMTSVASYSQVAIVVGALQGGAKTLRFRNVFMWGQPAPVADPDATCGECLQDEYQSVLRLGCDECPPGTGTAQPGAYSVLDCMCLPGTFRVSDEQDTVLVCSPCLSNTEYQPFHSRAAACLQCPAGSHSTEPDFTSCMCAAGEEVDVVGNACKACAPTQAALPQGGCGDCEVTRQGTSDRLGCECKPGFETHATFDATCNPCLAGWFKPEAGPGLCRTCLDGFVSEAGQATCTACSPGSYSTGQRAECAPCAAGMFVAAFEASTCDACDDTEWSAEGASACTECSGGLLGLEDRCVCAYDSVPLAGNGLILACPPNGTHGECGSSLECIPCARVYNDSSRLNVDVGTHKEKGARECTPCPLGQSKNSNGNIESCQSCLKDGQTTCPVGTRLPECVTEQTDAECIDCAVEQDLDLCFGFRVPAASCVREDAVCVVCNIGLLPDGHGGCRVGGRRADSVAYDDDHGRVLDRAGAMLWATSDHVMQTFSFGTSWTCGIEQYSAQLYASQLDSHVVTLADAQDTSRRTVSVDCRYDTVCALYVNDNTSTAAMFSNTTANQTGSVVACLGDPEWYLPWEAVAIARGSGHACAIVQYTAQQPQEQPWAGNAVYCWGSTVWGNAPARVDAGYTIFTVDARKLVVASRTSCAIARSTTSAEYGDVHCWGYSLGFFGRYDTTASVVRYPIRLVLPAATYAREAVLLDIAKDNIADTIAPDAQELEVVLCMLLDNYMIVCKGKMAHSEIKDAWRLAAYHRTFPTRIAPGPKNGELCVVYNYYDEVCWDVRLPPPVLPGATVIEAPLLRAGTLLQAMQPTLWYSHRAYASVGIVDWPKTPDNVAFSEGMLLLEEQRLAYVFPKTVPAGGVCAFEGPYCENSQFKASVELVPPIQAYPSSQRWMYLVNPAGARDGEVLLRLPAYGKNIWFHKSRKSPAGVAIYGVPYLTFSDDGKPWTEGQNEVRADISGALLSDSNVFDLELMFVTVRTHLNPELKRFSTDILVRIGAQDVVSNIPMKAATFRLYGYLPTTDLPAIDVTSDSWRLMWVALQTGHAWSRETGDTLDWTRTSDSMYLWNPFLNSNLDVRNTQQVSMLDASFGALGSHVAGFRVGACGEGEHDENDPHNAGGGDQAASRDCMPCQGEYVKPLAHMTSCMRPGPNLEQVMRRAFDGSVRMGAAPDKEKGETSAVVARCRLGTVVNPYVLDAAGNPSCTDCLSLPCSPWEDGMEEVDGVMQLRGCDPATGSRKCESKQWTQCPSGVGALLRKNGALNCVAEELAVVDTREMKQFRGEGAFYRTYNPVAVSMLLLPSELEHPGRAALLAYAQPRPRRTGSDYHIMSLGQPAEVLAWKTSINPTCTLGLFWYEGTEAVDVCIGSLCIRYERESITVSVKADASATASARVLLATAHIRGNSFTENLEVRSPHWGNQVFIPPYHVTNVTIEIRTHKRPDFALSTDVELDSVSIWTMGQVLALKIPYQELYDHMARTAYPASDEPFPYVYVALQMPTALRARGVLYERKFVAALHLKLGTPVPSSAAVTDAAYRSTVFIAACFDSFRRCGEIRQTIFGAAAPFSDQRLLTQGTARRRLLQGDDSTAAVAEEEGNGDFDAVGNSTFVTLDQANFQLRSMQDEQHQLLQDFRLTLRIRLSNASDAEYADGLVLSNKYDGSDGGGSAANGMRVHLVGQSQVGGTLVSGKQVRMHLCGVQYVTDELVPGEWSEFAFVLKTQSVLTLLHNDEAMVVKHFPHAAGNPCNMDNTKITVGTSKDEPSAVGVDLQFVILNENILVRDKSVLLDGVFVTDGGSLPSVAANFTRPVWRDSVLENTRTRFVRQLEKEFRASPVTTYAVVRNNDAWFYARVYTGVRQMERFQMNAFVLRLNSVFALNRLPPVQLSSDTGLFTTQIVPLLSLRYRTLPPLVCGTFRAECEYDGLLLSAHSVSMNKRAVLDAAGVAPLDFQELSVFMVQSTELTSHMAPNRNGDMEQAYWGSGFDCALDFYLRTMSDTTSDRVDLRISYPTGQWIYGNRIYIRVFGTYDNPETVTLQVNLKKLGYTVFTTELLASSGFQHVRITLDTFAYFSLFVDGAQIQESRPITWYPHFNPDEYDGVMFESTILGFADGVREISSIHFVSNQQNSCRCRSACTGNQYPDGNGGCVQCPLNTMTLTQGVTSVDGCVCANMYARTDPGDATSCKFVPPTVVYVYNATEDKKKGHCSPGHGNNRDQCAIPDYFEDEEEACSCLDECVYANPWEKKCCRNKCTVCPGDVDECDCMWDAVNQVSFNNANASGGALCSAAMCTVGQRASAGRCIACEANSFQPIVTVVEECTTCAVCPVGRFRSNCGVGSEGTCETCTQCEPPLVILRDCDIVDTVCVDPGSCKALAARAQCNTGEYFLGCDTAIGQLGVCAKCPIQDAMECPSGYFLNFLCEAVDASHSVSVVPNQCLPCNQARCPGDDASKFPSPGVCGDKENRLTMMEASMDCTQICNEPEGDEWLEKLCQFRRPTNATDDP